MCDALWKRQSREQVDISHAAHFPGRKYLDVYTAFLQRVPGMAVGSAREERVERDVFRTAAGAPDCLASRARVVVELKTTPFKPEYAGQLNFYLSAIDAQVKAKEDQPTIGLLQCKEKNRLVAEYALRGVAKPMGVAEYQFMREVPESLETDPPTIDQIEAELRPDS